MNLQLQSSQYVREKRAQGRPIITAEYVRSIINYQPDTGKMTSLVKRGGLRVDQEVGTIIPQGYRQIFIGYWSYRASRLAYLIMEGEWPPDGLFMDHIDGDRANDKWSNLRLATPQQNARNRKPCKRNTTGIVGVHPVKRNGQWGAEIGVDGSNIKLGCFECQADAVEARCKAERHYFGEFARRVSDE